MNSIPSTVIQILFYFEQECTFLSIDKVVKLLRTWLYCHFLYPYKFLFYFYFEVGVTGEKYLFPLAKCLSAAATKLLNCLKDNVIL